MSNWLGIMKALLALLVNTNTRYVSRREKARDRDLNSRGEKKTNESPSHSHPFLGNCQLFACKKKSCK